MKEQTQCPKCGSESIGAFIACGVPTDDDASNLGEFLYCGDCRHQWRAPEYDDKADEELLTNEEFVSVIFPIINGDR